MKLTEQNKAELDAMSYKDLDNLCKRSTPKNVWLQGETLQYILARMSQLRTSDTIDDNKIIHQYY